MSAEKLTPTEAKEFWAEIIAQAEKDYMVEKIARWKHENGLCNPDKCCTNPTIVYMRKVQKLPYS